MVCYQWRRFLLFAIDYCLFFVFTPDQLSLSHYIVVAHCIAFFNAILGGNIKSFLKKKRPCVCVGFFFVALKENSTENSYNVVGLMMDSLKKTITIDAAETEDISYSMHPRQNLLPTLPKMQLCHGHPLRPQKALYNFFFTNAVVPHKTCQQTQRSSSLR